MPPPPPGTPVHNDEELAAAWRGLMGPGGFGARSLWLIFFDEESRTLDVIMPIDDIPAEPDALFVRNLGWIVAELVEDGTVASCALLLSRPGPAAMTDSDRRWARALRDGLCEQSPWPIHLATRNAVRVFAPDDLIAA